MATDGSTNKATGDYARGKNVDGVERVMSVIGGTALALFALKRFSFTRLGLAALGANLVYRGITGHCGLYQRLGVTTAERGDGARGNLGTKVERAIIVYAPIDRVF